MKISSLYLKIRHKRFTPSIIAVARLVSHLLRYNRCLVTSRFVIATFDDNKCQLANESVLMFCIWISLMVMFISCYCEEVLRLMAFYHGTLNLS